MRHDADASEPVYRDRRAGSSCRVGRLYNRRAMRVCRLPHESAGEALAGRDALARRPDIDKGEFL
nr:MAG TPA: hypothetical protein [Caudoviricetes sp.]